jgi:hypothetical protein
MKTSTKMSLFREHTRHRLLLLAVTLLLISLAHRSFADDDTTTTAALDDELEFDLNEAKNDEHSNDALIEDENDDHTSNDTSRIDSDAADGTSISPASDLPGGTGGKKSKTQGGGKITPQEIALQQLQQQLERAREPIINATYAEAFKNWINVKSENLHELSMNYSGFTLLNQTYNVQLRKDARFAWINFTEMIVNISHSISEVLYNKTLVVKKLSDEVEQSFNSYANNSDEVIDSTKHIYYDAKSPKTFCDVAESYHQRMASKHGGKYTRPPTAATAAATTVTTTTTSAAMRTRTGSRKDATRNAKRRDVYQPLTSTANNNNHLFFTINAANFTAIIEDDLDDDAGLHEHIYAPHQHHNERESAGHVTPEVGHKRKMTIKRRITTTDSTTTTTTTEATGEGEGGDSGAVYEYEYEEEETDEDDDSDDEASANSEVYDDLKVCVH